MKKNLVALAICLVFVVLMTSCTGGGSPAIDLPQAQIAFAAAFVTELEGLFLSVGATGWVDDGTIGTHMKRKNAAGTITLDWNPSDGTYPNTATITAIGYLEMATGYTFDGTIVGVSTDSTNGTTSYNLTLSHPTLKVTSITGTLTTVSSVTTGSLSFNGVSYTYAELTGP